jgi:hypothetical protein
MPPPLALYATSQHRHVAAGQIRCRWRGDLRGTARRPGSYATTHEISIDGPLREYYLRGAGDTADEAEWRTEIGWPIFRADASRA